MKVTEVTGTNNSIVKLAALAQFVSERSKEADAEIGISMDAFVELAHDMGVSVTRNDMYDLVKQPPLSNLVKDIADNKITFQGQTSSQATEMPVDQAEKIVSKMAKRASKI
jgi:hypothetical protein